MKSPTTHLLTLTSLFALALATPFHLNPRGYTNTSNTTTPSNFYLVTTTQSTPSLNSSSLANVSLTTLFAPYYQPNELLRLIAPGYGSVPTFNISDGALHTEQLGPHGVGPEEEYNSTVVHAGAELQFYAEYEGEGDLGLLDGYLLGVNGSGVGWTICVEELGQSVVSYSFFFSPSFSSPPLRVF